jgi:gluconate 2-dehydrogenase gamma chain
MDTASRGAYRTPFASLPLARRTVLLDQFEKGEHRKAFDLVLDHSLQGYYGNPRHGGNAGFVSWRMLGVPPAPVRGRS